MDDERIIELFFARDEGAVTAASEKYGAYCRAVALGMLGDERDAQECVNDALYRLWAAIPPARPRSLRAFLGRITRNIAINTLRDSPERTVEDAEITACIDRWLDALPREQRVAFVRRYWYLDSIQTLASRMGWTTAKTASLLMRLRASLRKALISEGISI